MEQKMFGKARVIVRTKEWKEFYERLFSKNIVDVYVNPAFLDSYVISPETLKRIHDTKLMGQGGV